MMDLDDLLARQADVEAGLDVDLELRRGVAERGQRRDGCDLALAQAEARPRIDVAERKLDEIAGEIGRDVGERVDDFLARLAVDGGKRAGAALKPCRRLACCRWSWRDSSSVAPA